MKEENTGARDTDNTRSSGLGERHEIKWGEPGYGTIEPLTDKQKRHLLRHVSAKAKETNNFDLRTTPAETKFLKETLTNAYVLIYSRRFEGGRDWLIIAADEETARDVASRI